MRAQLLHELYDMEFICGNAKNKNIFIEKVIASWFELLGNTILPTYKLLSEKADACREVLAYFFEQQQYAHVLDYYKQYSTQCKTEETLEKVLHAAIVLARSREELLYLRVLLFDQQVKRYGNKKTTKVELAIVQGNIQKNTHAMIELQIFEKEADIRKLIRKINTIYRILQPHDQRLLFELASLVHVNAFKFKHVSAEVIEGYFKNHDNEANLNILNEFAATNEDQRYGVVLQEISVSLQNTILE